MVATPRYLSGVNGFVPEATGQVISYVRDPKKFKVNQYVQNIKSPAPVGLYHELDRDQPARIVADADWAFEDGDEAPRGAHNLGNFRLVEFRTQRRAYPFTLGWQAIESAKGWKPQQFHTGLVCQQAMTNRTKRVVDLIESSSNWGANVATADTLNAGASYWDTASSNIADSSYNAIKKSLLEAVRRINLATNALVQPEDLVLLISPGLAIKMANTSEIHDYLARSPVALAQLVGDKPGQNQLWGLPDKLYGIKLLVEDAVIVAQRPYADATAATTNRTYVKSDDSAVLMSRQGGIEGNYGSPSYSTVQCYFYEYELAVESFDDPKNKRLDCRVIEQFKEVLAAAPTGYLITDTLST
jgi:hypothetical protein